MVAPSGHSAMAGKLIGVVLVMFLGGCTSPTLTEPVIPTDTPESTTGWYAVYFTDPHSPSAGDYRGGPDAALAEAIGQAQKSVDCSVYDLNLWSMRDALLAAHQRGVNVRLVTESDNLDEAEIQDLKKAGVPVVGDRREGLMHNKFVVIDQKQVWTGTMNFTTSDGYLNDNNLVRVDSVKLAQDYSTEFEEMFAEDLFGPDTLPKTPFPTLMVDDTLLEAYFSPDDGTAARFIELIRAANQSIYFLAFSFTSESIADALLERAEAGVNVAGVFEETQVEVDSGSQYDRLRSAGLDVRLDGNPHNMHHKVIIIDGEIVLTGSYDFSLSAEETNDENTLVVHNPQFAALFLAEFERVFAEAQR